MSSGSIIFLGLTIAPFLMIVFGYALFNRRPKNGPKTLLGAKPGQGGTVVASAIAGHEGSHNSAIVMPRDPKEYAKAMAPKRKGNVK